MEPNILFEDEAILVLNKPSGWIVNAADTTKEIPVVQTWLKNNFNYKTAQSEEFRSGIVHRLDKETSGVLLVAKTPQSFSDLQLQFKNREIEKSYVALTHGVITPTKGEIKETVGRLPWNRERFGVLPGGRDATTKYQVSAFYQTKLDGAEYKNNKCIKMEYSLVKLYPKTGRTHQIRIHLKYLGFPIVSDSFYAGRKTAKKDRVWCPRLFLHALEITFRHPVSKQKLSISADLPLDLNEVINSLEKKQEKL